VARSDSGFSLVEVIIAMFLLAVIALAILPLAIGTVSLSVTNRSLVAANTLAGAHLAEFRGVFPNDGTSGSCGAAAALARTIGGEDPAGAVLPTTVSGIDDSADTGLTAEISLTGCPATLPGTVTLTVAVSEDGSSSALTTVRTNILVTTP
jgi:prepilin-type N-terminal cleavage/methylation domain-containing protein